MYVYVYIHICIYIYIYIYSPAVGRHCLSNATCLTRPRLFYASFIMSRIAIVCQLIRPFWRTPALDK